MTNEKMNDYREILISTHDRFMSNPTFLNHNKKTINMCFGKMIAQMQRESNLSTDDVNELRKLVNLKPQK